MLIAQDPHVCEELEAVLMILGPLKVARIQSDLECFEDGDGDVRQFELAFCCFLEIAV